MIRLRKPNGTFMPLDDNFGFVELCDTGGNPVFVIFKDGPLYKLIGKADKESKKYEELFGVKFAEHRELTV